jgi:hypothetical protein
MAKKDAHKSIAIYNEILCTDYKSDDYESIEDDLLYSRLSLASTIFELFRASSNTQEKLSLIEQMRKLPNLRTSGESSSYGNEDNWNESQTNIMLALMTRTMGSPIEYQNILEASFKTAIAGVTDSVGWNDADSFRLLAKVLACVPGLGRDAQIALSCQFSITDTSVEHTDSNVDTDSEIGDSSKTTEKPTTTTTTNGVSADGVSTKEKVEKEMPDKEVTEVVEKTTTVTIEQKAGAEPTIDVAQEIAKLTISDDDDGPEDLIPEDNRNTWCDGPCEVDFSDWSAGPIYTCIVCSNTDLNAKCYKVSS